MRGRALTPQSDRYGGARCSSWQEHGNNRKESATLMAVRLSVIILAAKQLRNTLFSKGSIWLGKPGAEGRYQQREISR